MAWSEERYNEFVAKMEKEHQHMFSQPYGGFAVGEGWYHIIRNLCHNIEQHMKWRRDCIANDIRFNRAKKQGLQALIRFFQRERGQPSDWDLERAEEGMLKDYRKIPDRLPQRVVVRQIKEKFGGLRFYYDGGDDQVHGMVRMAEAWASTVCEQCGNPGKLRGGGWVQTLCDVHEEERQKRYKEMEA